VIPVQSEIIETQSVPDLFLEAAEAIATYYTIPNDRAICSPTWVPRNQKEAERHHLQEMRKYAYDALTSADWLIIDRTGIILVNPNVKKEIERVIQC
jgi:hypothetical protein